MRLEGPNGLLWQRARPRRSPPYKAICVLWSRQPSGQLVTQRAGAAWSSGGRTPAVRECGPDRQQLRCPASGTEDERQPAALHQDRASARLPVRRRVKKVASGRAAVRADGGRGAVTRWPRSRPRPASPCTCVEHERRAGAGSGKPSRRPREAPVRRSSWPASRVSERQPLIEALRRPNCAGGRSSGWDEGNASSSTAAESHTCQLLEVLSGLGNGPSRQVVGEHLQQACAELAGQAAALPWVEPTPSATRVEGLSDERMLRETADLADALAPPAPGVGPVETPLERPSTVEALAMIARAQDPRRARGRPHRR